MTFDLFGKQHLVLKHNGQIAWLQRVDLPKTSKDIFAGLFYYAEQNGYLKLWLDVPGE